jgi:predicted O-methyltransferase YrrM
VDPPVSWRISGAIGMTEMNRVIGFMIRYLLTVVSCCYLLVVGFLFRKNRVLMSKICSHFGYTSKPNNPIRVRVGAILTKVELSEIVPESTPIQILEPDERKGDISLLEVITLAKFIQHYKPERIFEFGTFEGRTTLNLAANSQEGSKVYTLDLLASQFHSTQWPLAPGEERFIEKEVSGIRYVGKDCAEKIIQLYGDSATYDFTPLQGMMGVIFIDGSHAYEYVLNDSNVALGLLRNGGGAVLWHDYGRWEGVTGALNQLYSTKDEFKGLRQINGTTLVYCVFGKHRGGELGIE